MLRRSFDGTNTTLTVYAFGLEEHQYSYSGSGSTATNTGNTYYYTLAGRLLGTWDGTSPTTTFLLTDSLGSVVSSFNNPSSGAVMQGNQLYGPYGNQRLKQGSLSTNKGFTGQYNDGLTGLDYDNARYYDPTIGLFLSADPMGGLDAYGYVGGNPETDTDPSGLYRIAASGIGGGTSAGYPGSWAGSSDSAGEAATPHPVLPHPPIAPPFQPDTCSILHCSTYAHQKTGGTQVTHVTVHVSSTQTICTGIVCIQTTTSVPVTVPILFHSEGSTPVRICMPTIVCLDDLDEGGGSEGVGTGKTVRRGDLPPIPEDAVGARSPEGPINGACSFTSQTTITTQEGAQAIGTAKVGEQVWAYNPSTHTMELQPIVHVWVHPDDDLVDLTITRTTHGKPSKTAKPSSEVIHTNKKHPFLTVEKGFLLVGKIKLGMHVVEADGQLGIITGWKVVPGVKTMYNLEVAQDHTFTVGTGQWVVHNCDDSPFKMSQTVNNHTEKFRLRDVVTNGVTRFAKGDSLRPYINSPGTNSLIQTIMEGNGLPDPQEAANALRWDEPGFFNGTEGTWQLVVDMKENLVIHFLFQAH